MTNNSFDPANMFKSIYDFPEHLKAAMKIGENCRIRRGGEIRNIVVAGMGGSAIGGDVVTLLTRNDRRVPMVVSRHYRVPEFVDEHTLVICSSYSGNTEETLSAFEDARARGARIVGLSTGGTLSQRLDENRLDWVRIPSGLQPRAALGFSLVPMLFILKRLNLISGGFETDLNTAVQSLLTLRERYSQDSGTNPTRALAQRIYDSLPVIYAETAAGAVIALRWKGQLSENAKMLTFHNELPEMNHNEIVGWENNPELLKHVFVVWIQNPDDHPRVKIRQKISSDIIGSLCRGQETVTSTGSSEMERWLQLIHFGDWLSYWCAWYHRTDPTPVEKISALKNLLAKS